MLWFFWTLPVLLQRWFSTCLVCVHTLTPRENREKPEFFLKFGKYTILNEHPVIYMPPLRCISFEINLCYFFSLKEWTFVHCQGIEICQKAACQAEQGQRQSRLKYSYQTWYFLFGKVLGNDLLLISNKLLQNSFNWTSLFAKGKISQTNKQWHSRVGKNIYPRQIENLIKKK